MLDKYFYFPYADLLYKARIMEIREAVGNAFTMVKQDFDETCRVAEAVYWNEEVLRLNFFRHLSSQRIKITWFSAELETYVLGKRYQPDLIVYCEADGEKKRCVFEFKFWSSMPDWKKAWDRILAYKDGAFDYGFFLAIGPSTRVKEFPKETIKLDDYEAEALIYGKTWREAFGRAPHIYVAEELLKKTLNMPYHVIGDYFGWVTTIPQDYNIIFEVLSREEKCLLILNFPNFDIKLERWKPLENKLKEVGFEKYVYFDEKGGIFRSSDTFKGTLLLEELEVNDYPENVRRAKESLTHLRPILAELKPVLELIG